VTNSSDSRDSVSWRVFVSYTSEMGEYPKGQSYVAAVKDAISARGHVFVDLRDYPAADKSPAELGQDLVRGCQVYVGLLGTCYGSPVRDRPEMSYTELEFDTATEAGLDRLVFLLDTDATDVGIPPSRLIDLEFGARQEAFRRRTQDSRLLAQLFSDPSRLGQQVERSLRELAEKRQLRDGIFVSYRRQESKHFAGRLCDRLTDSFGADRVFIDVVTIRPGVDFAQAINRAVKTSAVLLAIIGPHWLATMDEQGRPRLEDPKDMVRLEIEAALADNVQIIPILVDETTMPRQRDLPESLAGLVRFNAFVVRHENFRNDAERLVTELRSVIRDR